MQLFCVHAVLRDVIRCKAYTQVHCRYTMHTAYRQRDMVHECTYSLCLKSSNLSSLGVLLNTQLCLSHLCTLHG